MSNLFNSLPLTVQLKAFISIWQDDITFKNIKQIISKFGFLAVVSNRKADVTFDMA